MTNWKWLSDGFRQERPFIKVCLLKINKKSRNFSDIRWFPFNNLFLMKMTFWGFIVRIW